MLVLGNMYEEQGWMDDILMADAGHAVNFGFPSISINITRLGMQSVDGEGKSGKG